MTILKRLALNLLRQDNSKGSLKIKRYHAGLNNNFLLQILSNSWHILTCYFDAITLSEILPLQLKHSKKIHETD